MDVYNNMAFGLRPAASNRRELDRRVSAAAQSSA